MTRTLAAITLLLALAGCQRAPFTDLQWRHGKTRFNVDRINGHEVAVVNPIVIDSTPGTAWILTGWAIDAESGKPATGVLGVIDNKTTVIANYGTERNDVAEAQHKPEYARTGWELHLENAGLAPGRHTLAIVILAGDGRGYYRTDTEWTIESR
jgi:hypothetical protein